MPKTIYLPEAPNSEDRFGAGRSGVDITWFKKAGRLSIGGWYDGFVGIENTNLSLRELFDKLGITEKDCAKAFKEEA